MPATACASSGSVSPRGATAAARQDAAATADPSGGAEAVAGHVHRPNRPARAQGGLAEAHVPVHARETAHDRVVVGLDVAAEGPSVGEDHPVAEPAAVR